VSVDHPGERHPAAAEFFDDPRVDTDRETEPAVFGRDQTAEEAELPHAPDEPMRVAIVMVQLGRDRLHLVLDEASDGGDERMPGRVGHGPIVHCGRHGSGRGPLAGEWRRSL